MIPDEDAVYFDDDIETPSVAYTEDDEEDDRISLHLTRKASAQSEMPLLGLDRASFDAKRPGVNSSQKVYIESEDLTIVITGFKTSWWKSWIYIAICVLTLGLGWLVFRWFPRWRVALTAKQAKLGDCEWVIVEVCPYLHVSCVSLDTDLFHRTNGKSLQNWT